MARVRIAIEENLPRTEHATGQGDRRSVQQNDVNGIGAELPSGHTRHGELCRMGVRAMFDEHREVHVAARRSRAAGRAAEQVHEQHARARRRDGLSKATDAGLEIWRQRQLERHGSSIERAPMRRR